MDQTVRNYQRKKLMTIKTNITKLNQRLYTFRQMETKVDKYLSKSARFHLMFVNKAGGKLITIYCLISVNAVYRID